MQCELLGIARPGVYRMPAAANDNHLVLMRPIDELFTAWPFLGLRRMTALLKAEGCALNQHMTTAHVMLTRRTVISNPLE
jgi:putative transposase